MPKTKTNETIGSDSSVSRSNQDTADDCDVSSGINFSNVLTLTLPVHIIVRIRDPRSDVMNVRLPGVDFSIVSTLTLPEPLIVCIPYPRSTATTAPPPNLRRYHR